MKNLSCYVMVVSALLFACSSESDDGDSGTGGASSDDGAGGAETPTGTGGSSPAAGTGGTAGSPGSAAGGPSGTPADAVGESGLAAATLVSALGVEELDTLCIWMESVLELERGATEDELYASGTFDIAICPETRETVHLWASPALCVRGLAEGRGESIEAGCSTLTVARFESCLEGIAASGLPESLCQLDDLEECHDFDVCYPDAIN